ncbi:MAG TPA: protein kinase [Gemmataceae bacterium]|jgi:serine/threonine protein kinase|nr:protein kinase [Gemmataceae bacterium]
MSTTISQTNGTLAPSGDAFPRVPDYEIVRLLGRGGMGCVYLAKDARLGREVAIKTLFPGADADIIERFRSEITAVAAIRHPNVLPVHHAGEVDGRPYFVMEYVAGGTLSRALDGKPIPPREAAALLEPVARAIQHCHEHGILHRDLKPGNILLANAESKSENTVVSETLHTALRTSHSAFRPLVADFGLAKRMDASAGLTRTGDILGTPAYMAPEQASGVVSKLGPGVDVYALGAILYEALTGRPPFQSPDPINTLMMVLSMDPISPRQLQPRLPRDIETICLKCLEKLPRKRYASAADLANDLHRFLEGRPIIARPTRFWEKGLKWAKRRPTMAALLVVSALSLTVMIVGGIIYNARLHRSNDRLANELDRSEQMFRGSHQLARYLLVEHMNNLSRLKGSTTTQKALVDELLPYLDGLASQMEGHEQVAGDVTVPEVASAYEQLARVQGFPGQVNLGDTAGAKATFQKAVTLRRSYQATHPDDVNATLDLARCVGMFAEVFAATGDRPSARANYTEALELVRDLPMSVGTGRSRWQIEQDARYGLADLRIADGDRAGGLADLNSLLPILRQAAQERPGDWLAAWNLAQVLGHVAEQEAISGDFPSAKTHFDEALRLSVRLADFSRDDVRFQHELAVNFDAYGDLVADERDYPKANQAYETATKILRGLVKADPDGRSIRRDLYIALEKWGRGLTLSGKPKEAVPLLEECVALARDQARDDPTNQPKRKSVEVALTSLGWAYGAIGKLDGQRKCFIEALDSADADKDIGMSAELNLFLAVSFHDGARGSKEAKLADYLTTIRYAGVAIAKFDEVTKVGPLTPSQGRLLKVAKDLLEKSQKKADELKAGPAETKKP